MLMNWFPLVRTVIITVISVALYLTDSGENTTLYNIYNSN